jgi:hypothetical protein
LTSGETADLDLTETVVEAATTTIQVQLRAPAKQGILNLAIMVNWVRPIERVILDLRYISIQVGSTSTITEKTQVRLTSTTTEESSTETSSYAESSDSTTSLPEPPNPPNTAIYVIIGAIAVIAVAAYVDSVLLEKANSDIKERSSAYQRYKAKSRQNAFQH